MEPKDPRLCPVRCRACGHTYTADEAYNLYAPCPKCQSTVTKEVRPAR